MLRDERDYLMRMIAAAAAIVARLRERLKRGEAPAEVVQEARAAQGELLGKDASLLRALDGASAARLIGDRDRLAAWAELLRVEADALRLAGDVEAADRAVERAKSLDPQVERKG